MKTKLRFLFVLLTMLWWGANFAWGDTEMCSAYLSGTSTPRATNCTLKFYDSEDKIGSIPNGEASGDYYYAKMNDFKNFYEITLNTVSSGYASFRAGDKITVYLYANGKTIGFNMGSTNKPENKDDAANSIKIDNATKGIITSIEHTLTSGEIEGNGTLRLYRSTSNTYFAGITVTTTRTANLSGPDYTVKTYPYTWDFTTDWTSSQTQCTTTYDDWQQFGDNVNYYNQQFPTEYDSNYPIGFGIDKLKGLRFSHAGFMAVDWNYGHLWLFNGNITIPGTTSGQIITVVMEARDDDSQTVTGTNTEETGAVPVAKTLGSQTAYTFHSTGGDVTLAFVKSFSIRSISVTNPVATWDYSAINATMDEPRPNKGYITFTSGGTLAAGTITAIPGLTITMPQNMTVRTVEAVGNRFSGIALFGSPGQSISFTPAVNGYLSFLGNIYNTTSGNIIIEASSYYTTLTEHTMPVLAGQTYTMTAAANYGFDLNSIGFRPAFLVPDKTDAEYYDLGASAEQTTKFEATTTTDKSSYPKLITAAQAGTVRFSESTWTAYLYDNNDVELNGYGDDLYVRGRVYAPAPHQDNQLNAYYLLYANVLQLTSNSPTTDATTNDVYLSSLSGNTFTFTFNQTLTNHEASKVKVYKDGSTSPMSSGVSVSRSDANLVVTFSTSPAAGETYRIVVEKDAVNHSSAKNAEIIRTFSITSSAEPPISMIWPTGVARVGDPIVLQTNVVGTGMEDDGVTPKQVGIDNSFTVTGTLKAEGETDRIIKANIVANRLVFKPETPLSNNKTYTLYLPASNYNSDIPIASSTNIPSGTTGVVMAKNSKESNSRRVLKHDKSFVFKTATSSGSEPTMTGSSPSNLQKGNISYDNGTIKITFDQAVEITPYTTINATPVNGSEATAHGSTALSGEAATLYIDNSNNRTICFDYLADGLKYDLWTEVVIPANSIIGTGGKPNSEDIKFRFKMDRNPNSTPVDADIFYPHTWDFNRFGVNTSTITNIGQQISQSGTDGTDRNYLKSQKNVLQSKRQDKYLTYVSHKFSDTDYDQGNDVYIMLGNGDGTGTKYKLPEFEGLRISLVNKTSDRFEIRDLGDYQKENEDTGSGQLNADGTHKYIFRLNGNTHYVTLSNVPAGKLYMVVNAPHLGINSPNATFANVAGATIENNGTLMNTNGTKKVVVNVTSAGDVSFCVKNFNCEKIAVSDYSKTFKSTFAVNKKSYATDCVNEGIRHDLVNAFTDDKVKAYYVSATSENIATATELTETTTSTAASKGGEGVIVVLQKAVGADTEIPFFVTDVNTAVNTSKNLLKGTTTGINNFDNSQKNKYFFSNVYTQLSKDETELGDAPEWITTTQMGFYRAVGSKVSAHKAWLEVPTSGGSARQYYLFKFFDDGETPTAIDGIETKAVNDDAWYSLQGVRVTNPVKGNLYIHNGKKVVIK